MSCLRGAAGLLLLAGVATGCADDGGVTVNDDTGGPTSTGDEPTTTPGTMSTTATSMSASDPSTSSTSPTTLDTDTTGEPDSSTTDEPTSTTTMDPTEGSGTTMEEEGSSSSSSSSGEPPDQECPYGDLMVPDSVTTSTVGEDSEFSSSCGGNGAPDVSYTLTAPEDGVYVIDTAGSAIDTIIAVYDGECMGELIACNNDDPIIGPQSRLSLDLTAGQTVTVVADGFAIGGGAVTINVAYFEGTCPNGDLGGVVPTSTSGSTLASDNTLVGSCGGGTAGDESFTFTAPQAGLYTFDTLGSDFDTVLYVRDACNGNELGCNDNGPVDQTSSVTVSLEQDEQVVVIVDGAGLESGNYDVNVEVDVCPDADLGSTIPQTVMGSTVGGVDANTGTCGSNNAAPDVAYTFTAAEAGIHIFDTVGSDFDTRLYVYDGASCGGTELVCNDDIDLGAGIYQSRVAVDLAQDQVVTIVVDGFNGASGNYVLNVSDSCGDYIVNGDEVCDGFTIGENKCEDLGYAGGALDCADDCSGLDASECSNQVVAVCSQPAAFIDSSLPDTPDTIVVPDMGTIADVDLFVDITHTYIGDLVLELSADDLALSNTLVDTDCGTAENVWAFFNDEGIGVPDCEVPIAIEGNATPVTAFSAYDGSELNGSWTLTVTDTLGGDSGTLNEWCIYFTLAP